MTYILLSIFCNVLLLVILKGFNRYKIPALQGIVMNYFVAGSMAFLFVKNPYGLHTLLVADWKILCLPLGILFISIFYLISLTSEKIGIAVAAVANKMSVVIPVLVALKLYGDNAGLEKIIGLILAMTAVYLTVKPSKIAYQKNDHGLLIKILLPLTVFIGSGIIDALVNYAQKIKLTNEQESALFIAGSFYIAGITGILILISQFVRGKSKFEWRSIPGGILLGVPNYFSIFFIMLAISGGTLESSQVYPIVNMGVVLGSAFAGILLFKEKLSKINYTGVIISILAIALIAGLIKL